MARYRVIDETLSLSVYDIVGEDGGEPGFVGHTGLAEATGSQHAANVSVLDMGPPFRVLVKAVEFAHTLSATAN